jgi:hypothetical protein
MKYFIGLVLVLIAPALASAQTPRAGTAAPRTAWGDPDLQGIWDYWTFTPLERPKDLAGKTALTDEEATQLAQRLRDQAVGLDATRPPSGNPGAYSQEAWTDRARPKALTQTSIIVDPPDGKIPPLTERALKMEEAHRAAGGHPVRTRTDGVGTDGPEDRGVAERCLLGFSTGPPMLPGGYNNNVQLFQTRDYVAMLLEMNHDVRIVPLDGRPALPGTIRQWMGNSRGRWEGNTLVVETTNFTDKTASFSGRVNAGGFERGSAENLRLIERFTRVNADTLVYEFTVNDSVTFTRPFTGRIPMNLSKQPIYEYACHEGNYGLRNMLLGARSAEQKATESK